MSTNIAASPSPSQEDSWLSYLYSFIIPPPLFKERRLWMGYPSIHCFGTSALRENEENEGKRDRSGGFEWRFDQK